MTNLDTKIIERGVALILKGMGVDARDPNFRDTPARVAKLYKEILTPDVNNMTVFPSKFDSMVVLRQHRVTALCPHHLMPVTLKCYVAYIPNKQVLGLSKLARVVEQHLTKPIMQEELCDSVADTLNSALDPKGVACVLAGEHGCMRHRGVETDGDVVTSSMRGVFLTNPAAREEFLRLIGRP
jgi:GTP cyclohydrolase I